MLKQFLSKAQPKTGVVKEAVVVGAFVGAISVLLLIAYYVVGRFSRERAYREKWKDYNDCGWA